MEIDHTKNTNHESSNSSGGTDLIKVRAKISCPSGDYKKQFRNQFLRKDIELMVVSLKIFDWMVCHRCGEILDLNLEFDI